MRLDKFLSLCGKASRSETLRSVRRGEITVNGVPARRGDCPVEPDTDTVVFRGETVVYRPYTCVMLHKPDGVVSATEDRLAGEPTVLDLLPPELTRLRPGLFPCGRLDKNTTGLLILTNNGALAHRLLSPKCHVEKTYRFTCERALTDADCELLRRGVDIGEKSSTLPAKLMLFSGRSGEITVTEGKYHQIKRMFQAVCNKILSLERISFAGIPLDSALARGGWRELTAAEAAYIESK